MLTSTHEEIKVLKRLPFPKLMIDEEGVIILFTDPGQGMVVKREDAELNGVGGYCVGYHSTTWVMSFYSDYYGKVTLEQ